MRAYEFFEQAEATENEQEKEKLLEQSRRVVRCQFKLMKEPGAWRGGRQEEDDVPEIAELVYHEELEQHTGNGSWKRSNAKKARRMFLASVSEKMRK